MSEGNSKWSASRRRAGLSDFRDFHDFPALPIAHLWWQGGFPPLTLAPLAPVPSIPSLCGAPDGRLTAVSLGLGTGTSVQEMWLV